MSIEGEFLDGKSSKRLPALLVINPKLQNARLELQGDGIPTLIELDFSVLKLESRLANTPREISLGQGRLFLCEHSDELDELGFFGHKSSRSFIHRLESNASLVAVSVLVTAVFVWAVVAYGIPMASKSIAYNMPELATSQFGGTLGVLDKTVLGESTLDEAKRQNLREFLTSYNIDAQELNSTIEFREGLKANALALPGGEIIFTDGLVNLVDNDQELLAVYFHELGHLEHRHIVRRALQSSLLTVFAILLTGDLNNLDVIAGVPALLMDLTYSRQFEIEADEFALQQMQHHGIDVQHFASVMTKLEAFYTDGDVEESADDGLKDFLSTHPNTKQRIDLIKQYQ